MSLAGTAWRKLGITELMVTNCQNNADFAPNEKEQGYWSRATKFLIDIRSMDYEDVSEKQRNWAKVIKEQVG